MGNCNCKSKCDDCEHPDGVQITIEILENLPEDLLNDFKNNLQNSNKPIIYIWKETINNWFNK